MGSKYNSENAYSRSGERSRERSRDRFRDRSPDRSQDRSRDRSRERYRERSRDRSLELNCGRIKLQERSLTCSNLALDVLFSFRFPNMSFEDPESGRGTGMGVVSTARTTRPVAHWMQAGELRSPLLAILFLQSPMQPEKVAGRQLQTTCLNKRTNVQR